MSLTILIISLLSLLFGTDEAEIVFAGDAMMHQGQLDAARRSDGSYDFSSYFKEIEGYVKTADYAVVNLETPLANAPYSGYPCFNAPSEYVDALADAGFKMFLTANNHTLDRHDRGLVRTIDALDARKLDHIGTYKNDSTRLQTIPFLKTINNIKVGFLNYTYGTNGIKPGPTVKVDYIDRELIKKDVEATRNAGAEIIVACVHWGVEYQLLPHSSQRDLAKYLKSLGVEMIIGGHPHVIQPMELTTDSVPQLTVYSLGNFISNMKTRDTRGGAMLRVRIMRDENGKAKIKGATYRLVFTEPAQGGQNYKLNWAEASADARSKAFRKAANDVFRKHNKNVSEELIVHLNKAVGASSANSKSPVK